MKNAINIVIVSLNEKFCKGVATCLAESLEMFNADCEDMVSYSLINPKEVLDKCGLEYFKKKQKAAVRNCSEYENTVLSISYDLFKTYQKLFENSLVVYVKLPEGREDKVPNKIETKVRGKFLEANCQIMVEMQQKATKKCVNAIIQKMGEYYENR